MRARRPRRHDPNRRERILDVVEELIVERGIEGLTHRVVAERADVSLSSTTYYFTDREAMIKAALERAVDRFAGYIKAWAAEHAEDTPEQLAEALADSVMSTLDESHRVAMVQYELHLAALRRPGLRETAEQLTRCGVEAMTPIVGASVAARIPPLMNGLSLQVMTAPEPPSRAYILGALRHAVTAHS
ncbi:TetR family transcriptional regulator [Streptomyces sp. NPDC050636]|uniref:TetR/AcrR family transcriptional regulator n=1 Tax=Streptomyces sp. NPDC050636 TaxID=3154510 RepID=UPI00344A484B